MTTSATLDARAAGIDAWLKTINPKGGEDLRAFTAFSNPIKIDSIPTGALTLDAALGVGGVPRGRLVELYGPESSGKTSLALSIAAQAIKLGGAAGFVDVEHAVSFEHVRDMGVDLRYFVLSQPNSGEEALQRMEEMARSGLFDVVTLDSIAALVPQRELDGDIGDQHVGLVARLMSQTLRKLTQVAAETNVTMIFINQLREKIGVLHGNPETTPGGRAMKFYASVRMEVRSAAGDRKKEGSGLNERVLGQTCRVRVVKNKVAQPFRRAEYDLYFGEGIDTAGTIVDAAVNSGVWTTKPGGTYLDGVTGESVGPRGKEHIKTALRENPEWAAEVEAKIRAALTPVGIGEVPDDLSELEGLPEPDFSDETA